jgi:hypothetical protein
LDQIGKSLEEKVRADERKKKAVEQGRAEPSSLMGLNSLIDKPDDVEGSLSETVRDFFSNFTTGAAKGGDDEEGEATESPGLFDDAFFNDGFDSSYSALCAMAEEVVRTPEEVKRDKNGYCGLSPERPKNALDDLCLVCQRPRAQHQRAAGDPCMVPFQEFLETIPESRQVGGMKWATLSQVRGGNV